MWVRQHIPRSLLSGRLTSGHSQAMDSAIGEHLLTINNCRTRFEDDYFSVLHRARNKFHLKFPEVIYISMNRPSLCRQLNNHTLDIFGELLDIGGYFVVFSPLSVRSAYILHIYIYIYIYTPFLVKFPVFPTWKDPDEKGPSLFYCFT